MNIIIDGSGISGLACANLLQEHGINPIISEASHRIGGLIACDRVSNILYHRVGGHVFNSKNKSVLDWFWKRFDRDIEFVRVERNAKILLKNRYLTYPIENSLCQLDRPIVERIIGDLLLADQFHRPLNFHDFLLHKFGRTLCDMYFFPYNEKIWQCSLKDVPLDWLEGKLPAPSTRSIIVDNILRKKEADLVHSTFYYPVTGGSQFIVDRLSKGVLIETNSPVEKITVAGGRLIVNEREYQKVIYTGDIRNLENIIDSSDRKLSDSLRSLGELRSNGTSNMLCECDHSDMSWLYLPEATTKAHRIIYTGNFSPYNNRNPSRSSCVVEFSGYVPHNEMIKEIKALPGNLLPIVHNYQRASYVIHDPLSRQKVSSAITQLNKVNIYPLGRFAEWQYYNMDAAIESAMKLVSKLDSMS